MLTWGLAEGRRHAQERGTQVRPQSNVRSILRGQQWRRVRYVSVYTHTQKHTIINKLLLYFYCIQVFHKLLEVNTKQHL